MTETIKLNLIPDTTELPVLHCSQFDDGRIMYVDLFEGDQPFILAEGSVVKVNIRKLDNNVISNVCTYETIEVEEESFSRVTVTATEQMTACYGRSYGELQISVNDTVIGTLNFYLDVERDPMQGGIDSASEIDNLTGQIEDIVEEVIGDDYYNKSQVDDLLDSKADASELDNYYTKSQADTLLSGKADVSALNDYYTKTQADTLLSGKADTSDLDNYYTKSQADTLLSGKADVSALNDYYTKTQSDNLLSGKVDNSTLNNYYTKTEVDQKFLDIMPVKSVAKSPIASFYTSIGNYPIVDMKCYINPTQSGSGDPYPAGGGKNKFNCSANYNLPINNNGVTVTLGDDGLLHFSGTCSTNFSIYGINQSYYGVVGTPIKFTVFGASETLVCVPFKNNNSTPAITTDGGTSTTLANAESDVFYLRIDLKAGTNYTGKTLGIVFSLASETITSFIPYSNIRPITGVSSVNVARTGKNIAKTNSWTGKSGTFATMFDMPIPPNTPIAISGIFNRTPADSSKCALVFNFAEGGNSWVEMTVNSGSRISTTRTFTKTVTSLTYYSNQGGWAASQNYTLTVTDFMIEFGSTASDYEAYQGNTYLIQLGDTYYGATLDVVSGKLVVDKLMVEPRSLGSFRTNSLGHTQARYSNSSISSQTNASICNCFKYQAGGYNYGNINTFYNSAGYIYFNFDETVVTTLAEAEQFMADNNVMCVVPLATPIEIDLTPTQINSLLGSNNIWHDGNGDIELKFKETIQNWLDQM